MSTGYNNVVLLGRLTGPPQELRSKAGKSFIKAAIAVSVYRKTADGASEEHTAFIPATMFGKTAETFLKFVDKGDLVHLAGRLDSRPWEDKAGNRGLTLGFI